MDIDKKTLELFEKLWGAFKKEMSNIDWNIISPIEEQMLKTTYLTGFIDGADYVKTRTQHTIANDIKS